MSSSLDIVKVDGTPDEQPSGFHPFTALWDVILEPARTFRALIARPTWWIPYTAGVLLAAAISVIIVQKIDLDRSVRDQYEQYGQHPSESQIASSLQTQRKMQPLLPLFGIAGYSFVFFGSALILGVAAQLMGSTEGYKTVLAIYSYAQTPALIASIAVAIVAGFTHDASLTYVEAQSLLKSNAGAFLGSDASAALQAAAGSLDVFTLAVLVLLVAGFAQLPGLSRRMGGAIPIVLWISYVGVKVGWSLLVH